MFQRYIAIGDSFTEGVGDELPDGQVRGWADLVALGLASAPSGAAASTADSGAMPDPDIAMPAPSATDPIPGSAFSYANLAIRGKLLGPIVAQQLEPALVQNPDLLSFNGGGNDIMRPRVDIPWVVAQFELVINRALERGTHVLLLSGANPSRHLPLGNLIQRRGDALAHAARTTFTARPGVTVVDNWSDAELTKAEYWSADKLHLNTRGHTRVATNVLTALQVAIPTEWGSDVAGLAPSAERVQRTASYYSEYVLPWIGRRLTGRSSGDGRPPKRPTLEPLDLP